MTNGYTQYKKEQGIVDHFSGILYQFSMEHFLSPLQAIDM